MDHRRAVSIRALGLAVVAVGTGLHLWWVFHTRLTSDQAIAGLMGRQIRHGQMFTFYWGQAYGGVEPYVVAAVTAFDPTSGSLLNLVPTLLAALTAVLVWRAARRIVPPGTEVLGVVAGAAMWLGPQALLTNSSEELGFRGVTLAAGAGMILLALRAGTTGRWTDLGLLGLVAGVGWWSSPEIVYFGLPAAGAFLAGGRRPPLGDSLLIPAGFLLGAGPWIATNIRSGLDSLKPGSSPSYVKSDYAGRLDVFVHKTLPMMLGFRLPLTGQWVWGTVGRVLCWLAVAALFAVAVAAVAGLGPAAGRWARRGLGAGLLAFPLIYAVFPATSYWQQGQYGVFLIPLAILAVTATVAGLLREGGRSARSEARALTALTAVGLVAAVALTLSGFRDLRAAGHMGGYFTGWGDQDREQVAVMAGLEAQGVRNAYAEYWVAYDLDYLSGGRLHVTDPYADRWVAEYHRVHRAPEAAWLFYHPASTAQAEGTFGSTPPGPYGYPESLFLSRLKGLGVRYRIVRAGVLDAVLPARSVDPTEVGIPPPFWR